MLSQTSKSSISISQLSLSSRKWRDMIFIHKAVRKHLPAFQQKLQMVAYLHTHELMTLKHNKNDFPIKRK